MENEEKKMCFRRVSSNLNALKQTVALEQDPNPPTPLTLSPLKGRKKREMMEEERAGTRRWRWRRRRSEREREEERKVKNLHITMTEKNQNIFQ